MTLATDLLDRALGYLVFIREDLERTETRLSRWQRRYGKLRREADRLKEAIRRRMENCQPCGTSRLFVDGWVCGDCERLRDALEGRTHEARDQG